MAACAAAIFLCARIYLLLATAFFCSERLYSPDMRDVRRGWSRPCDHPRPTTPLNAYTKVCNLRLERNAVLCVSKGNLMDVPCQQPTKPRKPFECALFDFMSMGKGRSQTLIVRYFVEQLVRRSELCEQGSILIFNPERGVLKLYEELKANNLSSIADFPSADFDINQGLAGLAFRKRSPEYAPETAVHPEFQPVPGQDIASIYCVPILLDYYPEPFGVVSFHNGSAVGKISGEKRKQMHGAASFPTTRSLSFTDGTRGCVPSSKYSLSVRAWVSWSSSR
jgi:hypothetical protein